MAYNSSPIMFQIRNDFVFKIAAVDAFTSFPASTGIATLNNKALDVSMELSAVIIFFATKGKEVLASFRGQFTEEFQLDVTVCCVQCNRHSNYN
jgi:hypothetical protein